MSYGLGPVLYLPTGASGRWRVGFTNPDGTVASLTGAVSVEFLIKQSPTMPDDGAELRLAVGAGITVTDEIGGVAEIDIASHESALIRPYGELFYFARAVLANGRVIIPDALRGSFFTDISDARKQGVESDEIMSIVPPAGNYVINGYDIVALTGAGKSLASVDISSLKAANPIIQLFFAGSVAAVYRLRAKGTDSAKSQWRVISTSDAAYLWELLTVRKEGADCIWSEPDQKFYQVRADVVDGAVVQTVAAAGFQLPLSTDANSGIPESAAAPGGFIMNRPEITGLTTGAKPLAAIDITWLKQANAFVQVFFTGSIAALYRVRAKGSDSPSSPWRVASTNDAAYLWELVQVSKEGAACVWSSSDAKFYQRISSVVDGVLTETVASTGFELPA